MDSRLKQKIQDESEDKNLIKRLRKQVSSLEDDLLNAKKKVDFMSVSRGDFNPDFVRSKTSIVNKTMEDYNTRSKCSHEHYSFKNNEIRIDEVNENNFLRNLENGGVHEENRRLRISLEKAVKRATLWQSKFFQLKEKIYRQTKKMTDEVNKTRKFFETKLKVYFKRYSQILREIVADNSKVKFEFNFQEQSLLIRRLQSMDDVSRYGIVRKSHTLNKEYGTSDFIHSDTTDVQRRLF